MKKYLLLIAAICFGANDTLPDGSIKSLGWGWYQASAWPEKKHGLFTYFLMNGMKGEVDTNGDKKLTVGERGDYIHENVSDMAGMLDREQTPGLETLDKNRVLV